MLDEPNDHKHHILPMLLFSETVNYYGLVVTTQQVVVSSSLSLISSSCKEMLVGFLLIPLVEGLGLGTIPLVEGLGLIGDVFSVVLFCFFGHLVDFFASFLSS